MEMLVLLFDFLKSVATIDGSSYLPDSKVDS